MRASPYISILGPDGSGKSTVISCIEKLLESKGIEYHYHHWCIRWKGPIRPNKNVNNTPHDQVKRGIFGSCAQLTYLLFLSYLSWLRWVYPVRKRGTWILLDRGPLDMLADPKRYRNGAPFWIRRLWFLLQPTSSQTFVLTAPAEIIHQRKAEVEIDSLRELVSCYRNLSAKGLVHISVDQPVEEVIREIMQQIELSH
jgi:thymidylate kinase